MHRWIHMMSQHVPRAPPLPCARASTTPPPRRQRRHARWHATSARPPPWPQASDPQPRWTSSRLRDRGLARGRTMPAAAATSASVQAGAGRVWSVGRCVCDLAVGQGHRWGLPVSPVAGHGALRCCGRRVCSCGAACADRPRQRQVSAPAPSHSSALTTLVSEPRCCRGTHRQRRSHLVNPLYRVDGRHQLDHQHRHRHRRRRRQATRWLR